MDINSLSDIEAYLNARTLMDMKTNSKKETHFPSDIDFEGRVLETSSESASETPGILCKTNDNVKTHEEAEVENDPLDPVERVKESLIRTLRICLSREEVKKIKREYVRNMKKMKINNEKLNSHDLDFAKVLEEVTKSIEEEYKNKKRKKRSEDEDLDSDISSDGEATKAEVLKKMEAAFVKPKFMKVPTNKEDEECEKVIKPPSLFEFDKSYTREKQQEKVKRNLERQKRKAASLDMNKKYLGFGETFDPKVEKAKKKEQRMLERKKKYNVLRTLKKANVSNEEKDLMNDLLKVAESSSSSSDSSSTNISSYQDSMHFSTNLDAFSCHPVQFNEFNANDFSSYGTTFIEAKPYVADQEKYKFDNIEDNPSDFKSLDDIEIDSFLEELC